MTEELFKLETRLKELKTELDKLKLQKEEWFIKKEDLKTVINTKIKEIKEFKIKKDSANESNSELRTERDKFNAQVKELITKLKKIKPAKENPRNVKANIERLEATIEIETNFKKEQKTMEEIKRLKRLYEEQEGRGKLQKEIEETKKKADELHNKIKENGVNLNYRKFAELSKDINNTKKEQEAAFATFIEFKNKFNEVHKQYKENQKRQVQLRKEVKPKINKADAEKEIIKQKAEAVEEKILNKKKLTTEDLIVLQGKQD